MVSVLAVAALVTALTAGLGGGGRGGTARHGEGDNAGAETTARGASKAAPPATGTPPNLSMFRVLAPGVGWPANGVGFYLTHDSGRRWTQATVPGLSGEDVTGDLTSTASPSPRDIALAFTDGAAARRCTPPATAAIGAGAVATTSDAGRSWHTEILPGCVLATSLSFISSKVGFALAGPAPSLYESTDGGWRWCAVAKTVPLQSVAFANIHDGWGVSSTHINSRAYGVGALYRTTDRGRHWRPIGVH